MLDCKVLRIITRLAEKARGSDIQDVAVMIDDDGGNCRAARLQAHRNIHTDFSFDKQVFNCKRVIQAAEVRAALNSIRAGSKRTIPGLSSKKALVAIDNERFGAVVIVRVNAVRARVHSHIGHIRRNSNISNRVGRRIALRDGSEAQTQMRCNRAPESVNS